jgi:hypothetical protein
MTMAGIAPGPAASEVTERQVLSSSRNISSSSMSRLNWTRAGRHDYGIDSRD